jgi:hypothetical protein
MNEFNCLQSELLPNPLEREEVHRAEPSRRPHHLDHQLLPRLNRSQPTRIRVAEYGALQPHGKSAEPTPAYSDKLREGFQNQRIATRTLYTAADLRLVWMC